MTPASRSEGSDLLRHGLSGFLTGALGAWGFLDNLFLHSGFFDGFTPGGLCLLARGFNPKHLFEDIHDFTEHKFIKV